MSERRSDGSDGSPAASGLGHPSNGNGPAGDVVSCRTGSRFLSSCGQSWVSISVRTLCEAGQSASQPVCTRFSASLSSFNARAQHLGRQAPGDQAEIPGRRRQSRAFALQVLVAVRQGWRRRDRRMPTPRCQIWRCLEVHQLPAAEICDYLLHTAIAPSINSGNSTGSRHELLRGSRQSPFLLTGCLTGYRACRL